MPRRKVSEQVAPLLLRELAATTQMTQSEIQKRLGVRRETVSRRLNQLETLGLVKRLNERERLNTWKPSISCLVLVHSWYAIEDSLHPKIEQIATELRDAWLIYRRYSFLKEHPGVLSIINNNVFLYLPYVAWRSPEGFARTYESTAESLEGLRSHPVQLVRETFADASFMLGPEQLNLFTRRVLGWTQFVETIIYTDMMFGFMAHLLEDKEIREFFADQMYIEDKRHVLMQEFRKRFLEKGDSL